MNYRLLDNYYVNKFNYTPEEMRAFRKVKKIFWGGVEVGVISGIVEVPPPVGRTSTNEPITVDDRIKDHGFSEEEMEFLRSPSLKLGYQYSPQYSFLKYRCVSGLKIDGNGLHVEFIPH